MELVYSDDTRFVCSFKIIENIFKEEVGLFDVSQFEAEGGQTGYTVQRESSTDGFEGLKEHSGNLFAPRLECIVDFFPENIHEFFQAGSVQYVDKEGVIMVFNFRQVIAETHKSGFSHSSGRDEHQIVSVRHGFDEFCGLGFAVAEVFGVYSAGNYERVYCLGHIS